MSLSKDKIFSQTDIHPDFRTNDKQKRVITTRTLSIPLINPSIKSYEHCKIEKLFQKIPIIIKTLASLCQILDDYPLTEIERIEQGALNSILWNEDHSSPIGLDQNSHLMKFRQLIREYIHEFLEFSQQVLTFSSENNEINIIIEKAMKYLNMLDDYRFKRHSAYIYFLNNSKFEDAMLSLTNIDQQQYHELRLIALHLRQFFIKVLKDITPKLSVLE